MQFKFPSGWRRWLVPLVTVLVPLLLGGGTLYFAIDDDGDGRPDRTFVVDPIDPGPKIKAPAEQVDAVADRLEKRHDALEHDDGPGDPLTSKQIDRNEALADRADIDGISPTLAGGATFNQRGCRTIPLSRNHSTRNAAITPTISGPGHITVSREIPGWGDVLGIAEFFNRVGTGASSHYVIDGEGHCAYIVYETLKAWTSGDMNPWGACQIEMIGMPDDNGWHYAAGRRKAALVLRDCSKRWNIPIQVGDTAGCNVIRPGFVDHNELECGNDHWDICSTAEKARTSGSDPCPLVAKIVRLMRQGASHLTRRERKLVRDRCEARKNVLAAKRGTPLRRARVTTSRYYRQAVRDEIRRLDRAHRNGRPWRFHHIGARRHELARVWAGKGCG